MKLFCAFIACLVFFASNLIAQTPDTTAKPDPALMERGEKHMGFSQTATTHHFLLNPNGGVIQVEANDPRDKSNLDMIQMHLAHINAAFQSGDFNIPMLVHDKVPPGAVDMKRLHDKIRYSVETTPTGGRVVIFTSDKEALAAIHQFLQFQIDEHKTGDPISH